MGVNTSTNMNLPIPQVGNESGPQYAQDVNNCLTLVDQHNHSPGYGVQINTNGLNINADLSMNANSLTSAKTVRFSSQNTTLTAPADIGCIYEVLNDLYFNDGLGNNIRLTQGGAVAGTPGSIANLVPPASASYVSLSQSFVFQSNTNVAANLDARGVVYRTSAASSTGVTLNAPSSIVTNYALALPLLPGSTMAMILDTSGNMSTSLITTSLIADSNVTTAKIADANVTRPKLAAVGQQISPSSGTFNTASNTPVDVTNLSVTITTSGRPVVIFCQSDGSGNQASFFANGSGFQANIVRDTTTISKTSVSGNFFFPSSVYFLDTPAAGTYTYKLQVSASVSVDVDWMSLVAYEL